MTALAVDRIRVDGGTQSRAQLDAEAIEDYAEVYRRKGDMPAVVVFYDGEHHWLADGFHRVRGAEKAGRTKINADVRQGSQRDAILFSVGANSSHGMRRTNADKRRAVELLLRDDEWGKRSDRWIAERCGVDHKTVARQRGERTGGVPQLPTTRTGQDGKARRAPARRPQLALVPPTTSEQPTEPPDAQRPTTPNDVDDATLERDPDTALFDLDEDIRRHMAAWEWPGTRFIAALEGWTRRARAHFERKERRDVNG